MAVNKDIQFWLSGGAANTDPNASIWDLRSTVKTVYDLEGTVTAVHGRGFTDSGSPPAGDGAGAHVGKYIVFVDGTAELTVSRIIAFGNTGWFGLFPLPSGIQVGDTYRMFDVHSLFDAISPAECAAGDVEYRAIMGYNNSGQGLNAPCPVWIEEIDMGEVTFEIAVDDNTSGQPGAPFIPNDKTEPSLVAFGASAEFNAPHPPPTVGFQQPSPPNKTLAASSHRIIEIRRTIGANAKRRGRVLAMIVMQHESASPAQTIKAGCLVALDADGYTPEITVTKDRAVQIGGGARIKAEVVAQETGLPVPDEDVAFSLAGDLLLVPDGEQTNDDGILSATYHASEDPDDAGDPPPQATITVKV